MQLQPEAAERSLPFQRNFAYMDKGGCGGVAFYLEVKPLPGFPLPGSRDALLPNGAHPATMSEFLCGSCGNRLWPLSAHNVEAVNRGE